MPTTQKPDYETVYTDFYPKVFAYVRGKINNHHDAEDLTADIFLKIYNKLDGYDPAKASLSTWIYAITRNAVTDHFRTSRPVLVPFDDAVDWLDAKSAEDALGDNDEMLGKLYDGLRDLSEVQREVVILHYWYNLGHREISERMGLSYANTKKICSMALGVLRQRVK